MARAKKTPETEEVKAPETEEVKTYSFECSDPREEKSLQVRFAEAIVRANDVVAAMNDHKPTKEIKALKKTAKNAIDGYNNALAEAYYRSLAKTHGNDAVREALKKLFVPDVIQATYKTDDNDRAYLVMREPEIQISLVNMQQTIGKQYFAGPQWFTKLQTLSQILAVNLHRSLDAQAGYVYEVEMTGEEMADVLGFKDAIDPADDSTVIAAIQSVVDDILNIPGDDGSNVLRVDGTHWTRIRVSFARYSGVLSNAIGSPLWTAQLVAEMIYGMLNNIGNKVETM